MTGFLLFLVLLFVVWAAVTFLFVRDDSRPDVEVDEPTFTIEDDL